MFKNDYKSAIDSIDTSDAQSRVISAVLTGRKRKIPYYTYFAATAAAVLCIITIALQPATDTKETIVLKHPVVTPRADAKERIAPVKEKADVNKHIAPTEEKADVNKHIAPANEKADVETKNTPADVQKNVTPPENILHDSYTADEAVTDTTITEEPQKAESEKSTTTQKNEIAPIYVMMDVNHISPKVTRSVSVPMMMADFSAKKAIPEIANEQAPASGGGASGGGGGGSSAEADVAPEIIFSTYEQYCEYSGTDISGKINLPSGMSANEFTGVPLNSDGEIENADYTFSFSGSEKEISVTLTEGTFAESYLNDETYKKSVFGETEAVITRSDTYCNAYFMLGRFSYDVQGFGITDDELKNIILSLIN